MIRFSVPYDPNLSKNKRYADKRSKRLNPRHITAREQVAWYCKLAYRKSGEKIPPGTKVWFSVCVCKPNHCSDGHNMMDDFLDACASVIRIDDRWFSIALWDWEINRENPHIECSIYT
jgi:hypothetical protein